MYNNDVNKHLYAGTLLRSFALFQDCYFGMDNTTITVYLFIRFNDRGLVHIKIIKSIEPNKSTYKIKMGQIDPFRHQRYLISLVFKG